jgi:hypothetical protein
MNPSLKNFFGRERKKRRENREEDSGSLQLDSASSRKSGTTVNRPWTCPPTLDCSATDGVSAE